MKKSILLLLVAGIFAATPVLAAEHEMSMTMKPASDCLQHCAQQSESITKKIERLQGEVNKGTSTYSLEELRKIQAKLDEANFMLDQLNHP